MHCKSHGAILMNVGLDSFIFCKLCNESTQILSVLLGADNLRKKNGPTLNYATLQPKLQSHLQQLLFNHCDCMLIRHMISIVHVSPKMQYGLFVKNITSQCCIFHCQENLKTSCRILKFFSDCQSMNVLVDG